MARQDGLFSEEKTKYDFMLRPPPDMSEIRLTVSGKKSDVILINLSKSKPIDIFMQLGRDGRLRGNALIKFMSLEGV